MTTTRNDSIELLRFVPSMQTDMLALILSIQRDEFGFDISAEDQPDLLDVAGFYQRDAGDFWVALCDGALIGTIALRDIGTGRGRCARGSWR